MIEEIKRINNLIFKNLDLKVSEVNKDIECDEYSGHNFLLNNYTIKFRKSKVTPKKIGQFVTLWKRNLSGETEPFNENDDFDFYIVLSEENDRKGCFIFPKQILVEKRILTRSFTKGKRGFRVYADWNIPASKQANTTKCWQKYFFIDLTNKERIDFKKIESIMKYPANKRC